LPGPVCTELRKRSAKPSAEVVARSVRVTLREEGQADVPGHIVDVVATEAICAQMIPGWPYSVIAALEPGRTSWTAVLDAIRLGPDDDKAEVTASQVREVITRLSEAGH
jgi:hypothetical protein